MLDETVTSKQDVTLSHKYHPDSTDIADGPINEKPTYSEQVKKII